MPSVAKQTNGRAFVRLEINYSRTVVWVLTRLQPTAAGRSRAENPHFHPFPGAWLPINSILGHAHQKYK